MSKVIYVRRQSNTTYLAHEVHILFFTTKQTSQPSHANDDNPHRQNMLRPHFPVNSIVQNDVLTQTALRLIGRNRNHHHIFHTIRDTKQSQLTFRKQTAQPTGGTLESHPIRVNVIQMNEFIIILFLAKISLYRF